MNSIEAVKDRGIGHTKYNIDYNKILFSFFVLSFIVLLALRDVAGIGINKFLFVIITFIAVITLDIENMIYLFCFVNPLCVGLPSKYMIILFILPFIINHKKLKLDSELFFFSIFAGAYILLQNVFCDTISMESMIFPIELIFVMLLFAYKSDVSSKYMAIFFILGVAILGIIMLLSELRYFSFTELMNAGNRLGTTKDKYFESVEMRVSVDPNYYGMFAITSLVLGSMAIKNTKTELFERILIITALSVIMVVAFIGLSRSFILVSLLYAILFLIKQKKVKSIFAVFGAVMGILLLMLLWFPDVVQTLLDRFTKEDSVQGANGRGELMALHFKAWYRNVLTILFGTGLMKCNVHCMPLQYLFGGGIILFVLMLLFFLSLYDYSKRKDKKNSDILIALLPMLVMSCTIPIAMSLTQLFTIMIVIYCANKEMI